MNNKFDNLNGQNLRETNNQTHTRGNSLNIPIAIKEIEL